MRRPCRTALTVGLVVLFAPSPAPAAQSGVVSLDLQQNVRLDGDDPGAADAPMSVAPAGDVNGDGRPDLVVGNGYAAGFKGRAWVIFGPAPGSAGTDPAQELATTLTALTAPGGASEGFRIDGQAFDEMGNEVAGGEDVNGDGLDDVVIAAFGGSHTYVVFGKADDASVDVTALGAGGFTITKTGTNDPASQLPFVSVALLPDVNGDGLAEIITSDSKADNIPGGTATENSGSAYVVFGRAATTSLDAQALGSAGYEIRGVAGDQLGSSVAAVPDMNGDAKAEVLVGAFRHNDDAATGLEGAAFVVFGGRAPGSVLDVATIDGSAGAPGFKIGGPRRVQTNSEARLGSRVAGGDVNGDGRGDAIVAAENWGPTNTQAGDRAGAVFVVFGRAGTAPVSTNQNGVPGDVGSDGYRIDGPGFTSFAGRRVALTPDVNGDGHPEVMLGAADGGGGSGTGAGYVVYGRSSSGVVPLAALGAAGFELLGGDNDSGISEQAGASGVAGLDVNSDGLTDFVLAAANADRNKVDADGATYTDATYVVHGRPDTFAVDLAAVPQASLGRIDGCTGHTESGKEVRRAGDVNGDGVQDVLIAAPLADTLGRTDNGAVYVMFGDAGLPSFGLCDGFGTRGFRIDGAVGDVLSNDEGLVGDSSVATADVNGDGRDDVIVGAAQFAPGAPQVRKGRAYVVFGTSSTKNVDLASFPQAAPAQGYRIDAQVAPVTADSDRVGASVAGVPDLDGDGRDEVAMSAIGTSPDKRVYVTPGRVDGATLQLPGAGTWQVTSLIGSTFGETIDAIGDLNGDGLAELLVSSRAGPYVVFGRVGAATVDVATLPSSAGYPIPDQLFGQQEFVFVASVADVVGDAKPDILVAGRGVSGADTGTVYVLPGAAAAGAALVAHPPVGMRIDGVPGDEIDEPASAGDLNGDGRADLVIGAPSADRNGRAGSGSAYVVYTKSSNHQVDLNRLGREGARYDGGLADDTLGSEATGVSDRTGDGVPELALGALKAGGFGSVFLLDGLTSDGFAPETKITAGPDGTISATSAQFEFTSSEASSTFRCALDGADFAVCTSPQAVSGVFDGAHSFRVSAVDRAGNKDPSPAERSFTVAGVGSGPPAPAPAGGGLTPGGASGPGSLPKDTTPPRLTAVSLSRRRFAVAPGATALSAATRKLRGTTIRFTVSEQATVAIRIDRVVAGRRSGKRCVTSKRKGKRCSVFREAGTLTRKVAAGRRSVRFSGRLGRRALKPGRYGATLVARDGAANSSRAVRVSFTIVR